MSAPSANDLFMNVWVSQINSEEFAQPGDKDWDAKRMRQYWAKVWLDCKELSMSLQHIETTAEKLSELTKPEQTEPSIAEELQAEVAEHSG